MTYECAYPVSVYAIPQHWIVVFAGRYEVVVVIVNDRGEIDVRDRSRMAMTG